MAYVITPEIRMAARRVGLTVKPSRNSSKKLDAYENGIFQCSFGAKGYSDYHVYRRTHGDAYAAERRRLYRVRHRGEGDVKYRDGKVTPGYCAWHILW